MFILFGLKKVVGMLAILVGSRAGKDDVGENMGSGGNKKSDEYCNKCQASIQRRELG
jgi:hypothetical protein